MGGGMKSLSSFSGIVYIVWARHCAWLHKPNSLRPGFLAKELALDLLETPVCQAWNPSTSLRARKHVFPKQERWVWIIKGAWYFGGLGCCISQFLSHLPTIYLPLLDVLAFERLDVLMLGVERSSTSRGASVWHEFWPELFTHSHLIAQTPNCFACWLLWQSSGLAV